MLTRQPISRAASALARALSPGAGAFLERLRSQPWKSLTIEGELIQIEWQCRNEAEIERGGEIARQAADMEIELPGAFLADLEAQLQGQSLRLEALVIVE